MKDPRPNHDYQGQESQYLELQKVERVGDIQELCVLCNANSHGARSLKVEAYQVHDFIVPVVKN